MGVGVPGAHTRKTHRRYSPGCDWVCNEETKEFQAHDPPAEQTNPFKGRFSLNLNIGIASSGYAYQCLKYQQC